MVIRWSRWSPQLALVPAVAVTLVAFIGAHPVDHLPVADPQPAPAGIRASTGPNGRASTSACSRTMAGRSRSQNLIVLGIGSALAIVFGFVLAAMIDREKRGESLFRTVFLYPLAVSLIVTGVAWRWILNPDTGARELPARASASPGSIFNWLAERRHRHVRDHPRLGLAERRLLHGADAGRAESRINTEIWSAARLDGVSLWRLYIEIIIPMMKFTFLTCAILLSLGVIKAYDIVVAMTNGGPGQSTWVPAYFTINALGQEQTSATPRPPPS